MDNFLDVDESKFHSKFLINGLSLGAAGGGGGEEESEVGARLGEYLILEITFNICSQGLGWLKPRSQADTIPIITPSQKKEASQCKFIIPKPGREEFEKESYTNPCLKLFELHFNLHFQEVV